jgi:hypothetical protein
MKLVWILITLYNVALAHLSQQEISTEVWKPSISSFNNFDYDSFLALQSNDAIRSSRDAERILTRQDYYYEQKKGDSRPEAALGKRTIELRFTERISLSAQAAEVSIYKTKKINAKGEERSFYKRFVVTLRNKDDVWRILIETDSSEGFKITEQDFNNAQIP